MLRKWCWFYGLLLLVISSWAFADSSSTPSMISSSAVTNHTDLSISLLSQLFGTVGNSLSGTSGQMLGKLFYELNVGMLVVAGLWMTHTVVTLIFGAATEGGFMNSRNNIVLAFLKIAIGIGALIPSPSTGYSPVQDIMMKVVVKSVEFADMTWSHGLDYLAQGGAVWAPPATATGGGLDIVSFTQLYAQAIVPTFNAEVCMIKSSIAATANSNSNSNGAGIPQELNPIDNDANMSFDFPSGQDPSKAQGCGSFQWGMIPGASSGGKKTTEGEYAYEAAYKVVYGLLPSAKNYACSISPSVKNSICSDLSKQIDFDDDSEELFNNTLAYVNEIMPMLKVGSGAAAAQTAAFLQGAQNQGWILAGRYSWDLSHLKDQVIQSSTLGTYVPPDFKPTDSSQTDASQVSNSAGSSTDPMTILWEMVQSKYNNYAGISGAGDQGGSGSYDDGKFTNIKFIDPILGSLVQDIIDLDKLFGSNIGSDPVYFLHHVGMLCIYIAGDIWIQMAVGVGLLMVIGIICSGGSVDLDKPIAAAVDWFKPLAMAVAGIFIISGGMLAFYIPVYSFFIFTFGVIAWFILVIETMVAAPLVAFGLTHPQGHDFLGKIEQGLMLLLGVFLRPVLMVIGLFAAMILSYIAFRMMNYGFASFMSDVFTSTPTVFSGSGPTPLSGMHAFFSDSGGPNSVGKLAMILICMPVLLLMYSTAVVMVVNQCYSLIYKLPDYIMRWIGAPQSESGISGMMQDIKGSAEGSSKAMGAGAAETTEKSIKGIEDLAKQGVKGLRKKGGGSTTTAPPGSSPSS